MKKLKTITVMLLTMILTACNTLNSVAESRGEGQRRTYAVSYSKVWNAVPIAIKKAGAKIQRIDKQAGLFLASESMGWTSMGNNIAFFITNKGKNRTQVEVVSKDVSKSNMLAKDHANKYFNYLEDTLGL